MLCRVLAYMDVEVVSQTVCKVELADFVVVVFTDTAIARSYLTRHSFSRTELKRNKQ
jgi:hypothetical protein